MITEPRMTRQQVRVDLKARFPYSNNADIAEKRRGVMRHLMVQRQVDAAQAAAADITKTAREILDTSHIDAMREMAEVDGRAIEAALSGTMQIGQTVTWTSSNLEKTGEIVAVVPAGEHPSTDLTPKVKEPGAPRDHDSYVVKANGKHYWPRVSMLSIGGE